MAFVEIAGPLQRGAVEPAVIACSVLVSKAKMFIGELSLK